MTTSVAILLLATSVAIILMGEGKIYE